MRLQQRRLGYIFLGNHLVQMVHQDILDASVTVDLVGQRIMTGRFKSAGCEFSGKTQDTHAGPVSLLRMLPAV